MTVLFWLDITISVISAVLAAALALLALGAGLGRGVNRLFALFALVGAVWAATHIVASMMLWLKLGNALLWQQISVTSFALMAILLLMFANRYLGYSLVWIDLVGAGGVALVAASWLPLLRSSLIATFHLDANGLVIFKLGLWGYLSSGLVILYYVGTLILFWRKRHLVRESYLAWSVAILLVGLGIRLLSPNIPITSFTATASIAVLGYGIVSQQLFNPLYELTAKLERKVEERTQELAELAAQQQETNRILTQRNIQMQTLLDFGRATNSILNADELLKQAVDLICERFGYYFAGVFLLDAEGKYVELHAGRGEAGRQLVESGYALRIGGQSMVGWTAAHRQLRTTQRTKAESLRVDHPLLADTRSEITLPLIVSNRLLGVLDVQSVQENAFGEQDTSTLQGLADQLAVGLQNARLFQEAQTTLGEAEVLYIASRRLTQATTTNEVASAITTTVAETGADGCVVVQFEFAASGEPDALLYLDTWRRDRAASFQSGLRLPIAQSPFPLKMISTMWSVADIERDETLPSSARQVFENTQARAVANIPLRSKDKVVGQVVVLRSTPGGFSNTALRLYEMLSDQAAIAMERARLLEQAQQRARREQLISEVATRIREAPDMEIMLKTAAQQVRQALRLPHVVIRMVPPASAVRADGNGRGKNEEASV